MQTLIKLVLLLSLTPLTHTKTCEELNCPICCIVTNDVAQCSDQVLNCQLKINTDFTKLMNFMLIIFSFLLGIPLILVIFDFLILRRIGVFRLSICEMLINGLCLCICIRNLNRKRRNKKINRLKTKNGKLNAKELGTDFNNTERIVIDEKNKNY